MISSVVDDDVGAAVAVAAKAIKLIVYGNMAAMYEFEEADLTLIQPQVFICGPTAKYLQELLHRMK